MPSVSVRGRDWAPRCRSSGAENRGRQTTSGPSRAVRHLRVLLRRTFQGPPHVGLAGRVPGFLRFGTGTPPRQSTHRERTSTASGCCTRRPSTASRMLSQWPGYRCPRHWRRFFHGSPSRHRPGRPAHCSRCSDERPLLIGRVGTLGLDDCVGAGMDARCILCPHDPPSNNTILLQPWAGCKSSSLYITLKSRKFMIVHDNISLCIAMDTVPPPSHPRTIRRTCVLMLDSDVRHRLWSPCQVSGSLTAGNRGRGRTVRPASRRCDCRNPENTDVASDLAGTPITLAPRGRG